MADPTKELQALRSSQGRLHSLVIALDDTDLERSTSDHGWNVSEVLSHLGSQSEIFTLFVDAGLNGKVPPSNDSFAPIWDHWNAKSPRSKASDALAADATFLDHLGTLGKEELARFEVSIFGMELDAAQLLRMRLGEHALHSWDVEVVFDERAVLADDATVLILETLGTLASRAGKPDDTPQLIEVVTSSPDRRFILDTGVVSLEPGEIDGATARIELSAEALIRLVYGRLDDRHLGDPVPSTTNVELDRLRAVFPGL
jgi:uncharacterized protein (TIGR03083 family)